MSTSAGYSKAHSHIPLSFMAGTCMRHKVEHPGSRCNRRRDIAAGRENGIKALLQCQV